MSCFFFSRNSLFEVTSATKTEPRCISQAATACYTLPSQQQNTGNPQDQAERLGSMHQMPAMEDYDLVQKITKMSDTNRLV